MSDEDELGDGDDDQSIIDVAPPSDETDPDESPLDDLASEVRARREAQDRDDPGLDADDLFEAVETPEIDSEAVWEAFLEGEQPPEEQLGLGAEVRETVDGTEHIVPKREFCQQCPHFTAPPETACTHAGTTIVEVVDADRFRVRNCPIVEEEPGASPVDGDAE